jgi:hypothetical protein
MPDLLLTCDACQETFTFSEAEQAVCEENAFPPPSRCPTCQRARKDAKDEAKGGQRRGGNRRRRR